ncbi:hypothetical protein Hanom_Chr12g01178981 [Helianthus anomalus]
MGNIYKRRKLREEANLFLVNHNINKTLDYLLTQKSLTREHNFYELCDQCPSYAHNSF